MIQNSYDGTPTLYIVPTPIGNLEDITLRAINILKSVDVIYSEDTRMTIKLLNFYEIKKKLIALHKHNEFTMYSKVIERLDNKENIALVSDRGTPLISDPGNILVRKVIEAGYNVVSLPGATALIPAITSSEFDLSTFMFYGFLDSKKIKREKELKNLENIKSTIIFYEAPHRLISTLNSILEIFGNRKVNISREISKKFEQIIRGNIKDIIDMNLDVKGEYVIVVEGYNEDSALTTEEVEVISIVQEVDTLIGEGISKQEAFKIVAKTRNMKKSDVFKEYHKE